MNVYFFPWILIFVSFRQNMVTDLKIISVSFFFNFSCVFVLYIVLWIIYIVKE